MRVCIYTTDDLAVQVVQAGALVVVIAAMKAHATNADVQQWACSALGWIARNGKEKGEV